MGPSGHGGSHEEDAIHRRADGRDPAGGRRAARAGMAKKHDVSRQRSPLFFLRPARRRGFARIRPRKSVTAFKAFPRVAERIASSTTMAWLPAARARSMAPTP